MSGEGVPRTLTLADRIAGLLIVDGWAISDAYDAADAAVTYRERKAARRGRQEDFPSDPQAGTPLESSSTGNLPAQEPARPGPAAGEGAAGPSSPSSADNGGRA